LYFRQPLENTGFFATFKGYPHPLKIKTELLKILKLGFEIAKK
jgi:hypothetical protein